MEPFDFSGQRSPPSLLYLLPLLFFVYKLYTSLKREFALNMSSKTSFVFSFLQILRLGDISHLEDILIPHHLLFWILLAIGIVMMHFNSVTRLLSGYPFFYLFVAQSLTQVKSVKQRKFVTYWMTGFALLVSCCAVNFYMPV